MTERFCAFCDNNATAIIDATDTPICHNCLDIYTCGQGNPDGTFTDYYDCDGEGEE